MRRFSLLGTFVVVFALIVGLTWLGISLVGRSFVNEGSSSDEVAGLRSTTTISRDQNGIPYIVAGSDLDAYAALGYAHAQDRLWQMDVTRRAGQGRLSEIFGRPTIGFDAMLRTIGFERVAERILRDMPKRTRQALDAYSSGVNAFLESHQGRIPLEFDALGYQPEPWRPIHSVLIGRLLAWELNTGFWTDVVFSEVRGRVDSALFDEVLPYYPSDAPTIIPGGQRPEPILEQLRNPPLPLDTIRRDTTRRDSLERDTTASARRTASNDLSGIIALEQRMRHFLGIDGAHIGSNSWAVAGNRTSGGKPMLANDPHLTHVTPNRWYQVMMSYSGQRVAGMTIPGAPFVVIGRNDNIAWGLTSMMADENDFYLERIDSATGTRLRRDESWDKITLIRDSIRVKDSASVPISIRIGRHGPIISDVHPFSSTYLMRDSLTLPLDTSGPLSRQPVSMRWRGNDVSHEMSAFQSVNAAKNLKEFTAAVRLGGCPSLSFVYADRGGTIAYVPSARVPVRPSGGGNLPYAGWEGRYDWQGSVAMDKLPTLVNPKSGYIASANNKVANDLPYSLGDLWEDPSRAIRLEEFLREGNDFAAVDFVQIQGDVGSPQMRYMVEFLLRSFPDSVRQGRAVRQAIDRLRRWNGSMLASSPEAAIAAVWFQTVVEKTFRDELGPVVYAHFVNTAQLPIKSLRKLTMIDSRWFDDVGTPSRRENRDDILRTSLGTALEWLHSRFNSWEIDTWRYGSFHTVTFGHPFGREEALKSIVNIGPFEVGGSNTTLNNAEWDFNHPYAVRVGASMRQIIDFSDTSAFLRSVITSGASGQPLSQFYSNQAILWVSNGQIVVRGTAPQGSAATSIVSLEPK